LKKLRGQVGGMGKRDFSLEERGEEGEYSLGGKKKKRERIMAISVLSGENYS